MANERQAKSTVDLTGILVCSELESELSEKEGKG